MDYPNKFYKRIIPIKWQQKAMEMSKERISSEYMRDERLTVEERTKKIYYGYLGEFAFADFCNKNHINHTYLGSSVNNSPDEGDFLMANFIIIDVKTQENRYFPQSDWRCEVTDDQIKRLPNSSLYVFCKLFNENELYIVGWLSKIEFLEKAIFHDKGTKLRGKVVHYPKWDVTIAQLQEISTLKTFLKNYE